MSEPPGLEIDVSPMSRRISHRRRIWQHTFLCATLLGGAVAYPASGETGCDYGVRQIERDGFVFRVDVRCRDAGIEQFVASDRLTPAFVTGFVVGEGAAVGVEGGAWTVPRYDGPLTLRYTVDLDGLARAANSVTTALRRGDAVLATLATLLLRPSPGDRPIRIRFDMADGNAAATALARNGDVWSTSSRTLPFLGYAAFGKFEQWPISLPGFAHIESTTHPTSPDVTLIRLDGSLALGDRRLALWVRRAGEAVARYFGGFPAERLLLAALPLPARSTVPYGRTVPGGGPSLVIQVGEHAGRNDIWDDWVLIHEMIHTATPFVADTGFWLMEGLATYLEPMIRARAGWLSAERVWAERMRGMPNGLAAMTGPGIARGGWGATYWGGATFMLLADLEVRERSAGRLGLEDCLRHVRKAFGDAGTRMTTAAFLRACDAGLALDGPGVATALAERYVYAGSALDLDVLWRDLGIQRRGAAIVFDDAAPKAPLRELVLWGQRREAPIDFD